MKAGIIITFFALAFASHLSAQRTCNSFAYQQEELKSNASLQENINAIETFTRSQLQSRQTSRLDNIVIKIPVVVHVLYHYQSEKISDAAIQAQIDALNKSFRRKNADTANAPAYFRVLGADCEIEFQLAISDPKRRSTSGIVRKYTPITKWTADDKVKFSSEMGDDAWDSKSYLNIWVCNLDKFAGYSSLPGSDATKDGVVIGFSAFGMTGGEYGMGKTAVHEIGHWLNLRHLWGDANCGDDGVDDTPKQASYTPGCPSTIRITCGNGPHGDMYMDYMDFTSDACLNMFTAGQKARMRALFEPGGFRSGILSSKGLTPPLISNIPVPDNDPTWLKPNLYPNPATTTMTLDLSYDPRWIGKIIFITNLQGQVVMNLSVTGKIQPIDINRLQAGVYFLAAKKDDGESIKLKFIKL